MAAPNFQPRTIFCRDNLDVLRGMRSGCIDLIYLDPPFNKKKVFKAAAGGAAAGAAFADIFREEDIKEEWIKSIERDNAALRAYLRGVAGFGGRYNYCYLVYMAIRLMECRRVLKETGSIYLHCDPTMSHYLKIVMDCIFGEKNFRNEVVWFYHDSPGRSERNFPKKHDIILYYAKTGAFCFDGDGVRVAIKSESAERYKFARRLGGREYIGGAAAAKGKIPENVWRFPVVKGNSKEAAGYPTQKPLALLERIIRASSGEGDMVLDPFCGSATTCAAAEKLGRQWAGIDISKQARAPALARLKPLLKKPPHFTTKPPKRAPAE